MPRHRVDLALLAVALVWGGSSYLAAKEVVHADGVFAFLALRFGMAVWGGLMLVLGGRRVARIGRDDVIAGSLFGVILAAICVGETYGGDNDIGVECRPDHGADGGHHPRCWAAGAPSRRCSTRRQQWWSSAASR